MIDKSRLGRLTHLGDGGSGVVYDIAGRPGVVYKELNQSALLIWADKWAEQSVAFRDGLSQTDRDWLDDRAVWPTDVVTENGRTVGVLMPRIPAAFFHTRRANDGTVATKLSEVVWLMQDSARIGDRFDPALLTDPATKFVLLAQIWEIAAWLHLRGVALGDVSHGNAVFTLNPLKVMLLDCDSAVTGPGTNSANGHNTPNWEPPEHSGRRGGVIDSRTDVWKLAMLTLRVLTPGKGALQRKPGSITQLAGRFPQTLLDLLGRAVGADPDLRPTAAEMFACVGGIARQMVSPPVAHRLDLLTEVCRRGETARIAWHIDGADSISVETPSGRSFTVDPAQHPSGFEFVAQASGLIAVTAGNRFGPAMFVLGPIVVYDVPAVPFTFGNPPDLPAAPVPDLPAVRPPVPTAVAPPSLPARSAVPALSSLPTFLSTGPLASLAGLQRQASERLAEFTRLLRGIRRNVP